MSSEQCIDIIKNRLTALVNSGQLKVKIKLNNRIKTNNLKYE